MTGFSPATRAVIIERDGGRCARCGHHPCGQIHHRRPRGMGGSKAPDTNQAANGLLVCDDCHHWIEHNRTAAEAEGLIVGQHETPAPVPVLYRGEWICLDDDGGLNPTRPVGMEVTTIHGNQLRRFRDGWSPLTDGGYWGRWTVYSDTELEANFILTEHR